MAKIEECTHMELYEIGYYDIKLSGSKIVLELYLNDILTQNSCFNHIINVSNTNISRLLKNFMIKNASKLNQRSIRCLINQKGDINYVSCMNADEWIVCKEVGL